MAICLIFFHGILFVIQVSFKKQKHFESLKMFLVASLSIPYSQNPFFLAKQSKPNTSNM